VTRIVRFGGVLLIAALAAPGSFVFSGSLNGDTIAGTIGIAFADDLSDSIETHPLTTAPVTMQKQ
jgi:hypothetical protein